MLISLFSVETAALKPTCTGVVIHAYGPEAGLAEALPTLTS